MADEKQPTQSAQTAPATAPSSKPDAPRSPTTPDKGVKVPAFDLTTATRGTPGGKGSGKTDD